MRSTNVRVVAVDGLEILQELTTGIEKTSSRLRSPVAFLSDRQKKRCVHCEGAAAYPGRQHGSAFLPLAHARPSATHVSPVGKGINLDPERWSSSLGVEGNYTKDEISDPRPCWFNFLPFCRMARLASVPLPGTNRAEATNGITDELFGFTVKLNTDFNWTLNYFPGREQPDHGLHKLWLNPAATGAVLRCDSSCSEWSPTHL
jgi:hypothetical protein